MGGGMMSPPGFPPMGHAPPGMQGPMGGDMPHGPGMPPMPSGLSTAAEELTTTAT
jgi:hypothetical protein